MKNILKKVNDFIDENLKKENDIPEKVKEGLTYYHNEEDPEKNLVSTPPDDEEISMKSIWIYEAYTPNYIENLINGIKSNKIDVFYNKSNQKDLINIIRNSRQGSSTRWINIGLLVPFNNDQPHTCSMELPDGISKIYLKIHQYIPSITVLSYQFVLDDNEETRLQKSISENYKTYIKKRNKTYQYVTPINQKRKKLKILKEKYIISVLIG